MNILILGSGGREHSLAWATLQNPKCDKLIVAPGNAGIAAIADCADIDILDGGAVVTFCEENSVDFVIVGPEAPLLGAIAPGVLWLGALLACLLSIVALPAAAQRCNVDGDITGGDDERDDEMGVGVTSNAQFKNQAQHL